MQKNPRKSRPNCTRASRAKRAQQAFHAEAAAMVAAPEGGPLHDAAAEVWEVSDGELESGRGQSNFTMPFQFKFETVHGSISKTKLLWKVLRMIPSSHLKEAQLRVFYIACVTIPVPVGPTFLPCHSGTCDQPEEALEDLKHDEGSSRLMCFPCLHTHGWDSPCRC